MATNLYDYAYELEKALRNSSEFQNLKMMYDAVENDPIAKSMFDAFRNVQMQLQQKQMEGRDITEDEIMEAQEIANQVQGNEKVTRLMEAEQQMSMSITELNKIIMKPLDELYGSMNR
ncbi:YlbF family regulator [Bacillus sp. FJAT-49711]|uniref:YlbF family regulator n=1 Tax=Bacillus sp. FJAT-49711 TaxID=2833585 RepID=UPI001BC903F0|nr:YlbF family regulator [Bacillus sp. FJAT-49711]MBS4218136.1 YlbF family regulator [Bacillus sp. FJAT-49711]